MHFLTPNTKLTIARGFPVPLPMSQNISSSHGLVRLMAAANEWYSTSPYVKSTSYSSRCSSLLWFETENASSLSNTSVNRWYQPKSDFKRMSHSWTSSKDTSQSTSFITSMFKYADLLIFPQKYVGMKKEMKSSLKWIQLFPGTSTDSSSSMSCSISDI